MAIMHRLSREFMVGQRLFGQRLMTSWRASRLAPGISMKWPQANLFSRLQLCLLALSMRRYCRASFIHQGGIILWRRRAHDIAGIFHCCAIARREHAAFLAR